MEICAYSQKSVKSGKGIKCQDKGCNNILHYDCKDGYSLLKLNDKTNLCLCVSCVTTSISWNIKLLESNRSLTAENEKLRALVDKLTSLETEIAGLKQKFE